MPDWFSLPQFENPWIAALFWITAIIAVIWVRRHRALAVGKAQPELREDEPGPALDELPALSMLIAAKDEEANIGRCLDGLLKQDHPHLQIVVINDRSDDATGRIIDEYAERDPRVRAVHITELPAGWFGKNHAMHEGVKHATGFWYCFSDADCMYDSPRLLSAAQRYAMRENVQFLSVLPQLEAGSFWEQVIQPAAGGVMLVWFPPQKVNNPTMPHAYANGAFMLMPDTVYEQFGGHEPVKATLNEDMHFARRAKQQGVLLRVIRGGGLYRVRMYVGLAAAWRGWSRIFYGCFGTFLRLFATALMLGVVSLLPYITFVVGPFVTANWVWMSGAGLAAILAQQSLMWRFYDVAGHGRVWALTYPLGAAICFAASLNAMRRLFAGTTTTWRGTTYAGGA